MIRVQRKQFWNTDQSDSDFVTHFENLWDSNDKRISESSKIHLRMKQNPRSIVVNLENTLFECSFLYYLCILLTKLAGKNSNIDKKMKSLLQMISQ